MGQQDLARILFNQVAIIFLLVAVGIFAKKRGIINLEAAKRFSNLVLITVLPSVMLTVFQTPYKDHMLPAILFSLGAICFFHVLAALVAKLLYRGKTDNHAMLDRFALVCANCGFMGIPLISASLGDEMLIYVALFIAIFSMYQWSHGAMLLTHRRTIDWKQVLGAPQVIAAVVGMILFFLQLRLPALAVQTLDYLAALNTPLPNIILGVFLADITLKQLICNRRVIWACILRLVALPLLLTLLFWAVSVPTWFDGAGMVALTLVICASCPVAVSALLLALRFDSDGAYGANLIATSTLLSIVTIPFVAFLAQGLLL